MCVELEGYCKIQWCLAGIQRIEQGYDMKRTRDDDEDGEGPSPAWMKKIKAYIKDKDDEAVTEGTVQETVQEETVQATGKENAEEASGVCVCVCWPQGW